MSDRQTDSKHSIFIDRRQVKAAVVGNSLVDLWFRIVSFISCGSVSKL